MRTSACRAARRRLVDLVLVLVLLTPAIAAATSDVDLDRLVDQSLAFCAAADEVPPGERRPILTRGLELADAALARDERSARAHFAIVCNLGKTIALNGLGIGSFRAVYRLRHEIDVTLRLAPDHPGALAAKGALLLRIPRLLGGDPVEAELWLRRALAVDPENPTARAYLEEIEAQRSGITPATETAIR